MYLHLPLIISTANLTSVTRTTTDSGSNFLKTFRVFGVQEETDVTAADTEADDDTEHEEEVEYHFGS